MSPAASRYTRVLAVALVVVTIAVYAPLRGADFVSWDDALYVTENPTVRLGLSWSNIYWALTTAHAPYWHPLTWLSHMLDISLFGLQAGGAHMTSVFLHAASSLVLFALFLRMTRSAWRSAFVAAMFAVHPLHVESVAWIAERKDVLSTFLMLLTIWAYLAYVRDRSRLRYGVVTACFALALMAKPMVVTLPFALLLLDAWPLGRRESLGSRVTEKLPWFALGLVVSVMTFVVQQSVGAINGLAGLPIGLRLSNAAISYVTYLGETFWPAGLTAFYPYRLAIPAWEVAAAVAILSGVSIAVWRARETRPFLLVGWLWFLGLLLPVIGVIQAGDQAHADRFVYVPSIGVSWMLAWGVPDLLGGDRWGRRLAATAGIVAVMACAIVARAQVGSWATNETMWRHMLAVTSGNYQAHDGLGLELGSHGKPAEAVEQFREALRIKPGFANGHFDFGFELAREGRYDEAIAEYTEALRLNPHMAGAEDDLGIALARAGRAGEAAAHYADAIRLDVNSASAHCNLGVALAAQGDWTGAMKEYREALRLDPGLADAHMNMGSALATQGVFAQAIAEFEDVVRLDPKNALAQDHWGHALVALGRTDEGIAHYSQALRLDPMLADTHNNMGVALAIQGRIAEATSYFTKAVQFKPEFEVARLNLAHALAASGHRDDAVQQVREALRRNPGSAQASAMLEELLKKTASLF